MKNLLKSKLGFAPPGVGPIGLDFGNEHLNLMQMELRGSEVCIRAANTVPFDSDRNELLNSPAKIRSLINRCISKRGFSGKHIVANVPYDENLKLVNHNYRKKPDQNTDEAIIESLKERFGDELNNVIVDYIPIRQHISDASDNSALVALAKRDYVVSFLNLLHDAGMKVDALDVGPAALTRLVSSLNHTGSHSNVLVINIGKTKSYISVVWGRRLILDRGIDFGEDILIDILSNTLDMGYYETLQFLTEQGFNNLDEKTSQILNFAFKELVEEVNKTLIFTASRTHGASVERVFLLGGVIRFPSVDSWLEKIISVRIDILSPFTFFSFIDNQTADNPLLPVNCAIAAGLALRGISTDV
ncbi:MAG: pilus assembly protein PilM [Gammaproteobacteria bacterium]